MAKKKLTNGKVQIILKYPIEKEDGSIIDSIYLERLKAKHLRKFPPEIIEKMQEKKQAGKGSTFEDVIPILQIMTGLSDSEMDEISAYDLNVMSEALSEHDFL